ncbi:MAG: hypothetical protein HFJ50_01435 [Clostridia bacterium]|jgi:ATP-dependent helicase/nuclease subunit B|nr:hypothetical protein [Clostridia bacterium]
MVKLIYGKAGSGKSTYLFEKIKDIIKENQKIYIITPEQFSFTAEKKLLEVLEEGATVKAEVLTFSRMAYRVISENGKQFKNIENFGKSMLVYDILDNSKKELKFLGKNLQNVELACRSITEFKKHNITVDRLSDVSKNVDDKYLKSKLEDMEIIYRKFQEFINDKFLDENDSLTYLANNLKNTESFNDSVIFIDEFVRIYSSRIFCYRRTYEKS